MIITTDEYLQYLIKRSFKSLHEQDQTDNYHPSVSVSNKWLGVIPFALKVFRKRKMYL